MTRVFRISKQRRASSVVLTVLTIGLFSVWVLEARHRQALSGDYLYICAAILSILTIELASSFVPRVVLTQESIASYDALNRKQFDTPLDSLTRYAPLKLGGWCFVADETIHPLPSLDFPLFHAAIAAHAPQLLNAKPWQCGQLPPAEEFLHLWMFDLRRFMSWILFVGTFVSLIMLLSRGSALGFLGYACGSLPRQFHNFFSFLDIRSGGLTAMTPWAERSILWEDATAVFCERIGTRRRYILTSGDSAIVVPSHVAQNLEPMRKFFYSIPDGTPCVNFDANFNRGYRVRRRKGKGIGETIPGLAGEQHDTNSTRIVHSIIQFKKILKYLRTFNVRYAVV